LNFVAARAHEFPESLNKRGIQSLNIENDVQVFCGPECESGSGHGNIARGAADQHIAIE